MQRRGAPANPNLCQKQKQSRERRKLFHPCYSACLQGFIPIPGRNLLAEVSIPFCRNGREFQYDSCQTVELYSALLKTSFLHLRAAFPLCSLSLTDSSLGLAERVGSFNTEHSTAESSRVDIRFFEKLTNIDFKP